MSRRRALSPEQLDEMRKLRAQGVTYDQLGKMFNVDKATCYYNLNEESLNTRRRYNKERQRELRPQGPTKVTHISPPMPEVPHDTRTPIQRHFGDPLPGRSALDMKIKEQQDALNSPFTSNPFRAPAKDEDAEGGVD